jgi:hypothetical protein
LTAVADRQAKASIQASAPAPAAAPRRRARARPGGEERIDADWILDRIAGRHGMRAALARATGLSIDKISKILSGRRHIHEREEALIRRFFCEDARCQECLPAGVRDGLDSIMKAVDPDLRAVVLDRGQEQLLRKLLDAQERQAQGATRAEIRRLRAALD